MRRRTILGLGVSCLLAACAHQGEAPSAGMAWSLHHAEGEGAKLAFGQPASDNVLLMMTCAPHSGAVRVSLATSADEVPGAIALESDGRVSRLSGQALPGMGEGSALLEAETRTNDPALAAFARTGDLSVVQNGRNAVLPVRSGERATVKAFFAECRAA
jgi:autotransporter translocation and assembly factor TamB